MMACAQPGDLSKCEASPLSVLKHFMQGGAGYNVFAPFMSKKMSVVDDLKCLTYFV